LRNTPRYEATSQVKTPEQSMPEGEAPAPSQTRFMPEGVDEDGFYSQLDKVITEKIPTRATVAQIVGSLGEYIVTKTETIDGKNKTTVVGKFPYTGRDKAESLAAAVENGRSDWSSPSKVKEDEIKWSGIEQALTSLEKDGKVSKEDLLNYLRNEGNVRFEEVTLSDPRSKKFHPGVRVEQTDEGWFIVTPTEDAGPFESREQAEAEMNDPNSGYLSTDPDLAGRGEVKFAQYVLPGGENYREVVLAMPTKTKPQFAISYKDGSGQLGGMTFDTKEQAMAEMQSTFPRRSDLEVQTFYREKAISDYTSTHFPDIPNYVAHMRTNERTDADGMEGLFAEEFQSDRHQAGRKEGYKEDKPELPNKPSSYEDLVVGDEIKGWGVIRSIIQSSDGPEFNIGGTSINRFDFSLDKVVARNERHTRAEPLNKSGVSDAPFRTTWPLQLFKRLLRDAVDSGKDWVGWTVGDTQNERFDLSKSVDEINYSKAREGKHLIIATKDGSEITRQEVNTSELPSIVGKDVAQRIIDGGDEGTLSGSGLQVGGSGMKGFYDTVLPKEIGKYVKPWGGKVENSTVSSDISNGRFIRYEAGISSIGNPAVFGIGPEGQRQMVSQNYQNQGGAETDAVSRNEKLSGVPIWRVNITPEMRKLSQTGQMRFLPEVPTAPLDTKFRSITEQGREMVNGDYKNVIPGAILGTMRFLPESENERILANFPLDDAAKKKMEGKAGFAFASDWSDSNRPYVTKNGREVDVLMGGVGYTYHPEVIGKGGWAGSFSPLTNRVLKKINTTDGIGLVVAGGRESTASSRSFSIAALEEIKDDVANGTISRAAIDNIIKNNAERVLGLTSVKSLSDYEKLLMLERGGSGLTFEQRAEMVKAINSHENKKKFGLSSWNDILKKYEMQSGSFEPGQIMSVVQFDKNAPLMKASDLNIKGHKSYEAVIQGKPLGMLKEKVMIGDFFKDFFTSEGTLPASYTRKVQTKMPSFKYGEGSAIFKEAAESIAKAEKLK